jgi:CBS domain-containing protein
MQAREIMTRDVVSVSPDTPTAEIARRLRGQKISAAPVVDGSGTVVGMVSEGDLIGRSDADREQRRDWWLSLIAEGEALNPDFLATLRHPELTARDVMSAPVVGVAENTEDAEIAGLLMAHRIKRVPVMRDGRMVGIVSRADLLRTFAAERVQQQAPAHVVRARSLLADALSALDAHFLTHRLATAPGAPASNTVRDETVSATDFRELAASSERRKIGDRDEASEAAAERRRQQIKELIDRHITEGDWKATVHRAREAAEHCEKESMLLRFPSDLCSDRGRAINAPLPDWPKTLRGEAAEIYQRWERELKPRGFHLTARVIDFPGGKPGDIGLFLVWGQ